MKTQLETSFHLQELMFDMSARGMSSEGLSQVETLIRSCWDKGVGVILDPTSTDSFGMYHPGTNNLTLGADALNCNVQFIETLEHEFIHVLQDEIAGIHNSDMGTLGIPTTDYAETMVEQGYSHLDSHTQALEAEAFAGEQMLDAGGLESMFA